MKVYEIQDFLIDLVHGSEAVLRAEEAGEDVAELKAEMERHWQIAQGITADKMDGVIRLVKNLQIEQKALKDESARMAKRAKARENQIEFIKAHLIKPTLELLPNNKVKTITGSLYFMNTESVEITDESAVPAKYKEEVITVKLDKKSLKFDLKDNEDLKESLREDIPGCFLKHSKSVVIR
jgi:hypothetical protein